jgi:hypothetical protein
VAGNAFAPFAVEGAKLEGRPPMLDESANDGLVESANDGLVESVNDGLVESVNDGLVESVNDGLVESVNDGVVRDGGGLVSELRSGAPAPDPCEPDPGDSVDEIALSLLVTS